MIPHMRLPLLITLTLALTACGTSDPKALTDQGSRALAAGDNKSALESFDQALAKLDPKSPEFLRASMGHVQARARQDQTRAKDEFLDFVRAHSDKVTEQDYNMIVGELVKKGAVAPATEIIEAGLKTFPESPNMKKLRDLVGDAAKKSKDPKAINTLKGLGYAGSDESR